MSWIVGHMKWIMLLSGVLTFSMIDAGIDPDAVMESTFGEPLRGAADHVVVRSWGVLIALVGGMLVYGAFVPTARPLVLTFASLGKAAFIRCWRAAANSSRARPEWPWSAIQSWCSCSSPI